jgi:hypothetical protein
MKFFNSKATLRWPGGLKREQTFNPGTSGDIAYSMTSRSQPKIQSPRPAQRQSDGMNPAEKKYL